MVLHQTRPKGRCADGFSTGASARARRRGRPRGASARQQPMSERGGEHPHRCQEGHRWQHTGPTALTCEIPHEAASGELSLVGFRECPLCSGREEVLVRDLHSHYCNMCEGDWDHEGRCLDGNVACCPWCFPTGETDPAPGARRGPHFHYCPECTQNWRHTTACSATLRAVRVFLVVCVVLAIPILLKVLWSWAPSSNALVSEQRADTGQPASPPAGRGPDVVTPPQETSGATEPARPSEVIGERLAEQAPSIEAHAQRQRDGEPIQESRAPETLAAPVPVPDLRERDVPAKPAAPSLPPRASGAEDRRAAPSATSPSPPPRGHVAEPPPGAPDTPQAPREPA